MLKEGLAKCLVFFQDVLMRKVLFAKGRFCENCKFLEKARIRPPQGSLFELSGVTFLSLNPKGGTILEWFLGRLNELKYKERTAAGGTQPDPAEPESRTPGRTTLTAHAFRMT